MGWGAAVLLYTVLFSKAAGSLGMARSAFRRRTSSGMGALHDPDGCRACGDGCKETAGGGSEGLLALFSPRMLRVTSLGTLLGVGAHGGYYALMTWLPTYLRVERHLSVLNTGWYLAASLQHSGVVAS